MSAVILSIGYDQCFRIRAHQMEYMCPRWQWDYFVMMDFMLRISLKLNIVVYVCNPSTWGVEERRIQVWDPVSEKNNPALLLWWFSGTQWDATCLHLSKCFKFQNSLPEFYQMFMEAPPSTLLKLFHRTGRNTVKNWFYEASIWYQNQITKREN